MDEGIRVRAPKHNIFTTSSQACRRCDIGRTRRRLLVSLDLRNDLHQLSAAQTTRQTTLENFLPVGMSRPLLEDDRRAMTTLSAIVR